MQCVNTNCQDGSHNEELVALVLVFNCGTSYSCLPLTGKAGGTGTGSGPGLRDQNRDRNIIPGWSTEVEPYCKESKLCYSRWVEAGKPRNGPLLADKLRSHALFRHTVRRVKRCEKLSKAKGLFNAAMAGYVNLFKEMKKIKSGAVQMEEMAETVDGSTGEKEIVDMLTEIFKTLFNSSDSNVEIDDLQNN